METVILFKKNPCNQSGGRPMKLGALLFNREGRRGLFVGYDDQGRKIALGDNDLIGMLKNNHLSYRVEVSIKRESNQFSMAKFLSRFIPAKIKDQLVALENN